MTAIQKLTLVDPLTLMGREIRELLPGFPGLINEMKYVHTAPSDEHEVTDLAGQAALVPPLASADDLEPGALLLATDIDTPRLKHVEAFLDRFPETLVVDAGRLGRFADCTTAAAGGTAAPESRHLRLAHPALVAATTLLGPLAHLEPLGASVAAVEPVSVLGRDAVEGLARQATSRLQGEPVSEPIGGHSLAFSMVALGADRLGEEAAQVLPGLPIVVTRCLSGCFHGHLVQIGITFEHAVDESDLEQAWQTTPRVAQVGLPLRLDTVTGSELIALAPPEFGSDRRTVALTAMMDGLRLGALTTLEILQSLS